MSIKQTVWSLDEKKPLECGNLLSEKELEDLLCDHIDLLNKNLLVIGHQVRTSANKLIDILCMDQDGDIVIVELKRDLTPREVTAQIIDYASCIDKNKSEYFAEIYTDYTANGKTLGEAYREKFGNELDEDSINEKVKMIIVASKMDDSTERIITYLRDRYRVDINILFFNVFQHDGKRFISRAWFQEDAETEKISATQPSYNWNHQYYSSYGIDDNRSWKDAVDYGFISAGGGSWYTNTLKMLSVGDKVWVNIPHVGYVGVGIVNAESQMAKDANININDNQQSFSSLSLEGDYRLGDDDPETAEYIVGITWIHTVDKDSAVKETGFFGNQNSVCRPTSQKWEYTINRLKQLWKVD